MDQSLSPQPISVCSLLFGTVFHQTVYWGIMVTSGSVAKSVLNCKSVKVMITKLWHIIKWGIQYLAKIDLKCAIHYLAIKFLRNLFQHGKNNKPEQVYSSSVKM